MQLQLKPIFDEYGFRKRGRIYNRISPDGLTLVINFQMGRFDPSGTAPIPGLRENLYGRFTVNLGIYVPEVAKHTSLEAKTWVQEYLCAVRVRLGKLVAGKDLWWSLEAVEEYCAQLKRDIVEHALTWLARYDSRASILRDWEMLEKQEVMRPARVVCAIVLAEQGQHSEARQHLNAQVRNAQHPGHRDYVRSLARKLHLGELDG